MYTQVQQSRLDESVAIIVAMLNFLSDGTLVKYYFKSRSILVFFF